MKLVLRRVQPGNMTSPYCLQTADGIVLPQQVEVTVRQRVDEITRVIVEFHVDDRDFCLESSHGETIRD